MTTLYTTTCFTATDSVHYNELQRTLLCDIFTALQNADAQHKHRTLSLSPERGWGQDKVSKI